MDQAEREKKRILILRHGRPAAAIVPVHHAASVAHLSLLLKGLDAIVVPAIFFIEVALTLARAGFRRTRWSDSSMCFSHTRGSFPSVPSVRGAFKWCPLPRGCALRTPSRYSLQRPKVFRS